MRKSVVVAVGAAGAVVAGVVFRKWKSTAADTATWRDATSKSAPVATHRPVAPVAPVTPADPVPVAAEEVPPVVESPLEEPDGPGAPLEAAVAPVASEDLPEAPSDAPAEAPSEAAPPTPTDAAAVDNVVPQESAPVVDAAEEVPANEAGPDAPAQTATVEVTKVEPATSQAVTANRVEKPRAGAKPVRTAKAAPRKAPGPRTGRPQAAGGTSAAG